MVVYLVLVATNVNNAVLNITTSFLQNHVFNFVEIVKDFLYNAMMEIILMEMDVALIVRSNLNILVMAVVQIVKINVKNINHNSLT
jgi:hypothetical protein